MQLIDKEDDLPFALFNFLQNSLQPFLELAPVLGSRHQRAHIQRKQLLILQSLGNIPADDPLCQSFYHRRLADARFSDQHRIILCLSGKDPDHVPDLRVPADDRIQLLIPGPVHKIHAVFIQSIIRRLRVIADHPLIAADGGQRLKEFIPVDPISPKQLLHRPVGLL